MEGLLGILRHGEAVSPSSRFPDILRPLTEKGVQGVEYITKRLQELEVHFDLILTSPALRAYHTALLIYANQEPEPISFQVDFQLYNSSVQDYLRCLGKQGESYSHVLITGHNPTISELGNYLCSEVTFSLVPGQLLLFEVPFESWDFITRNSLALREVLFPES